MSGELLVSLPVALFAGFVSFFSPCVLPLVPAYFSYATGLAASDIAAGNAGRARMLTGAVLFILGFSVVYVALGVAASGFGLFTWKHLSSFTVVLGVLTIALGLVFLGAIRTPTGTFHLSSLPGVGLTFAPILGALFAIVWLPCVGPVLGAILTMATSVDSAFEGGLLLSVYTLGFGLPFVAAALVWHLALKSFRAIAQHRRALNAVAGIVMIFIGVAMLSGWWTVFTAWAQMQANQLLY